MTLTRTQLVALVARNALVILLVILLGRQAIASTLPLVSTDPPRSTTSDLPNAPTPHEGEPTSLHITILEGEGALNNIRQRTAREPIVQVEDENHKPVAGVLIFFSAHSGSGGAGATFNGLSTLSVKTGADGQAVAHGFQPNGHAGSFTINVSATYGSLTATAVIHQQSISGKQQSNSQSDQVPPIPIKSHHTALKWTLITVGIVSIIGIILLLNHNSGTNIAIGGGGVGHP